MNFTLKQLQIFMSVVNNGSTLAASHELNVTQPAVSAAINELESNLGAKVFDRWKKRIIVNERGRTLIPLAQLLLANAREINLTFDAGKDKHSGTLRIGASSTLASYVLPKIISEFMLEYPNIRIDLISSNKTNIISMIEDCTLDIGVVAGGNSKPFISCQHCFSDSLRIIAGVKNPLFSQSDITPEQLASQKWVMREEGSGTLEVFQSATSQSLANLDVQLKADNLESIKQIVIKSDMLGCISEFAIKNELETGSLKMIEAPYINLTRDIYTILHEQRKESSILKAFNNKLIQMSANS